MISIRPGNFAELPLFYQMERKQDTEAFILPYELAKHELMWSKPDVHYLTIIAADEVAGFIILAEDPDGESIEFRRIVVDRKGKQIGQKAIQYMESFCWETLAKTRIWLDVFDFNQRGLHVYRKLGYMRFKNGSFEGNTLHFMEKWADQSP